MKTFLFSVVSFGIGVTAGYFIGNIITKKKYYKIADKEVESVKESLKSYYEGKLKETPKKAVKIDSSKLKIDRVKADVTVRDSDSINYDNLKDQKNEEIAYKKYASLYKSGEKEEPNKEEESQPLLKPYIITPEEFAEGTFDTQTLNYYKDGILADDDYNIVKDINGTVGLEALNSFGVYEEDSVYVRNEEYGIDYEILFVDDLYVNVAPRGTELFPGQDDD